MMRKAHPKRLPAQAILLALSCVAGSTVTHASDTYDLATGQLTIAEMFFGALTYTNVVVMPGKIIKIAGGTPSSIVDTYAPVFPTGFELFAPEVVAGQNTVSNVTATIGQLISIGGVYGADSFDGTHLTITSVLANGKTYNNVVITIGRLVSLAMGMPTSYVDSYNSTTHQLSIPVVTYNGKIYTNAVVTVGNIVSMAGGNGGNSSSCYDPTYYATGTTSDLFYVNSGNGFTTHLENQIVNLMPTTFNGVQNAVTQQVTTFVNGGSTSTVFTDYYDIQSKFPILLNLGSNQISGVATYTPGIQYSGSLNAGQSLASSGTYAFYGQTHAYTTNYTFDGFEDVTVPAGTFSGSCKWTIMQNFGGGTTTAITWSTRKGILLQTSTGAYIEQLQPGSTFNGGPVGP